MLAAFLVRSASRLLLQDPAQIAPDAGLPPNPFAIAASPDAFFTVEIVTSAVIAGLAVAVALLCLGRLVRGRPIVRHVMWPILVAGIVAMSAAAFDAAETAYVTATGEPLLALPEAWEEPFSWLLFLARLLVPIGLVAGSLRLRRAGGPLVALAVGLGTVPSPVRLESALAAALGDPDLRLLRPDPAGGGWTAADGRPVAAPVDDDTHAVTLLEHEGAPLAAIVHDPVLREDPALVGSVMAVLRLAVENERLDALAGAARSREGVAGAPGRGRRGGAPTRRTRPARRRAAAAGRRDDRAPAGTPTAAATDAAPELRDELAATARGAPGGHRRPARAGPRHPSGAPRGTTDFPRRSRRSRGGRRGRRGQLDLGRRLPRHVESTPTSPWPRRSPMPRDTPGRPRRRLDPRRRGPARGLDRGRRRRRGRSGAGSGLRGLIDRLAAVDGQLDIESRAGRRHDDPGRGPARDRDRPSSPTTRRSSGSGVVRILEGAGIQVVREAKTADELLAAVAETRPTSRSSTSACRPAGTPA